MEYAELSPNIISMTYAVILQLCLPGICDSQSPSGLERAPEGLPPKEYDSSPEQLRLWDRARDALNVLQRVCEERRGESCENFRIFDRRYFHSYDCNDVGIDKGGRKKYCQFSFSYRSKLIRCSYTLVRANFGEGEFWDDRIPIPNEEPTKPDVVSKNEYIEPTILTGDMSDTRLVPNYKIKKFPNKTTLSCNPNFDILFNN